MRLIDADTIFKDGIIVLPSTNADCVAVAEHFIKAIHDAPTIEAEPIKHGKWEQYKTETVYDDIMGGEHQFKRFRCSLCGYDVGGNNKFHYCPHCGADMRGSKDE